jgi:hypothetical protein
LLTISALWLKVGSYFPGNFPLSLPPGFSRWLPLQSQFGFFLASWHAGVSAKAAAAPPKDIDSANIRAVINNVIRLFIFSHPLSLTHPKAPSLLLSQGVGALSLGLSIGRDSTTIRQPGYLSCGEVHRLCAPASRRVCLYRGAAAPERTSTSILTRRLAIHVPDGYLSGARRASCMPGSYSLLGELLRTPATRSSSQSTYKAKFAEVIFYDLG